MTHDEVTKHGANIIDLLIGYARDHGIRTFELFLIVIEVIKLMKKVAEENIKKSDS